MLTALTTDTLDLVDPPRIVWVRVQDALNLRWDQNPKLHDIEELITSIIRYGFQDLPKWDETLTGIKAGNGRLEAVALMEQRGLALPRGLARLKEGGAWAVPILAGTDAETILQAKAYAIDANNLTVSGSGWSAADLIKLYDQSLRPLAGELVEGGEALITMNLTTLLPPDDGAGNGEFADRWLTNTQEEEKEPRDDFQNPYVQLSFPATVAQRDDALKMLNTLKKRLGLKTSTEALLEACRIALTQTQETTG